MLLGCVESESKVNLLIANRGSLNRMDLPNKTVRFVARFMGMPVLHNFA